MRSERTTVNTPGDTWLIDYQNTGALTTGGAATAICSPDVTGASLRPRSEPGRAKRALGTAEEPGPSPRVGVPARRPRG